MERGIKIMLELDEAIKYCQDVIDEKENELSKNIEQYNIDDDNEYMKKCVECKEEHKQLKEWLEELENYRMCKFSFEEIDFIQRFISGANYEMPPLEMIQSISDKLQKQKEMSKDEIDN